MNTSQDLDKQTKAPNLFEYATSELTQDAFLSWLFEHIRLNTSGAPHRMAERLLHLILEKYQSIDLTFEYPRLSDYSMKKIKQQWKNIDLLITFSSNVGSENIHIILEDKVNSGESRKKQLEYYTDKLKEKSTGTIIPVLFKTGYASEKEKDDFENRNLVFIGYEDIYDLFSPYEQEFMEDVILKSWWSYFCERYYDPIEKAKELPIENYTSLNCFREEIKDEAYPEQIVFKVLTDYLFENLHDHFLTKPFRFQGKGHVDWHYALSRATWKSKERNISVHIYFKWDTRKFSLILKTAPYRYKPLKKLKGEDRESYMASRDAIKEELKNHQVGHWKENNQYLQIAHRKGLSDTPMGQLKTEMERELKEIARVIDTFM
ncbi:PD-(D/E)XK nuclease family protein [Halobacillus salinus]|uniref:PD-(D/E)XK nuclease family protein n=1 Tax=Halobacillus salinus TaxID=192814 RepID=UPI001305275B|nr:PD-(D/E)XK nuclease family protein [Halobacillus salinus]